MKTYVAYIRVSTKDQDNGLDVQRAALGKYNPKEWFIDKESGKSRTRDGLLKALALCKKNGYTLLFHKVDRLSRDAELAHHIRNSGVDLHCDTMPDMNLMVFGLMATFAQEERERISERTKDALKVLKDKGVPLGVHSHKKKLPKDHYKKMVEKSISSRRKKAQERTAVAREIAKLMSGSTLQEIANKLNEMGIGTSKGSEWTRAAVSRIL